MPFTLPKPALSTATAPMPDFTAATDAARASDFTTQKAERSTFDTLMSRHAEQVAQTHAAAKTQTDAQEAPKPAKAKPAITEKPHKLADKAPDKPQTKAADKSTDNPSDTDAAAKTDDSKPAETASATTAKTDDTKTADTTVQAQADTTTTPQTDTPTDPSQDAAAQAAALAIQAQAQVQAPTPTDANDADAQLALVPLTAAPKGAAQPATAPQDASAPGADAAQDPATSDAKAMPADFAALLGQTAAAPAQAPTTPTTTAVKPGKPAAEKTATKADGALVLPDLGKVAANDKDPAAPQVKGASNPADSPTDLPAGKDQAPVDRFAEVRDALQPQPANTAPQTPVMPQNLAPVVADAAAATPAPKQADVTTQTAFSIQTTAADVPGGYSATGAQTASATTLSKAAIDNMGALGLQISKKLSEGVTKFTLELHPADLGKVEVALNIDRDGKTTAHLRFDNPITASTFSAHESDLRQQLANAGLKLDDGALSFSSRDGGAGDSGQAFAQMFQGQEQASHGQAARALQTASNQADQVDANVALDAALAEFRNRPANSTLALNLVV